MGATLLARKVGCAQSLTSGLERNNAKGTDFNNQFAAALGVEPNWLATGFGRAPEGFDAAEAKRLLHSTSGDGRLTLVHDALPPPPQIKPATTPRWATSAPAPQVEATPPVEDEAPVIPHTQPTAASLQRSLMECYIKFVDLVGPQHGQAVLDLMHSYTEALRQGIARQDQV